MRRFLLKVDTVMPQPHLLRVLAAAAILVAAVACGAGEQDTSALEARLDELETQNELLRQELEKERSETVSSTVASTTAPTTVANTTSTRATTTTTTQATTTTTQTTTTTTQATTTTTETALDLRARWAPNGDATYGTYRGTATWTEFSCWGCDPPDGELPPHIAYNGDHYEQVTENAGFMVTISSFPENAVANDFSVRSARRTDFCSALTSCGPERVSIEIGPGYHDLAQFTLAEERLTLDPSRRYPWRLDFQKYVDEYGATVITGSAAEYELLADGSLRELRIYGVFTVALAEEA